MPVRVGNSVVHTPELAGRIGNKGGLVKKLFAYRVRKAGKSGLSLPSVHSQYLVKNLGQMSQQSGFSHGQSRAGLLC